MAVLDRRWRLVSALYVAMVTTAMAIAMVDPNHPRIGLLLIVLVLCLPVLVLVGPVAYVLVAAVWSATGADSGGPTWPVTLAYTVLAALVAAANAVLLHGIGRRRTLAM